MLDLVFVAVLFAFFAIAAVFVRACERIIGPDLETLGATDAAPDGERAAA